MTVQHHYLQVVLNPPNELAVRLRQAVAERRQRAALEAGGCSGVHDLPAAARLWAQASSETVYAQCGRCEMLVKIG